MKMSRILMLVLLGVLSGCAELQQLPVLPTPQPCSEPTSGAALWLGELNSTHDQSPEQLQQTLANWEQAYLGSPNINNRMRVALLLATGADAVRDTRRARRLLNGVDPLPDNVGDRELISLLQQWLDEQAQSVRKLDILWKQATEQNRRIEELEQQLQALTTIEQNIQSRDSPDVIENER